MKKIIHEFDDEFKYKWYLPKSEPKKIIRLVISSKIAII